MIKALINFDSVSYILNMYQSAKVLFGFVSNSIGFCVPRIFVAGIA